MSFVSMIDSYVDQAIMECVDIKGDVAPALLTAWRAARRDASIATLEHLARAIIVEHDANADPWHSVVNPGRGQFSDERLCRAADILRM